MSLPLDSITATLSRLVHLGCFPEQQLELEPILSCELLFVFKLKAAEIFYLFIKDCAWLLKKITIKQNVHRFALVKS